MSRKKLWNCFAIVSCLSSLLVLSGSAYASTGTQACRDAIMSSKASTDVKNYYSEYIGVNIKYLTSLSGNLCKALIVSKKKIVSGKYRCAILIGTPAQLKTLVLYKNTTRNTYLYGTTGKGFVKNYLYCSNAMKEWDKKYSKFSA